MKITKYILFLLLAVSMGLPLLTACNEDDDSIDYTEYYDWRDQNMTQVYLADSLQHSDSLRTYFNQRVRSLKEPGWDSFYHIVHAANLDSLRSLSPRKDYRPFSTSTLKVHYTLFQTSSVIKKAETLAVKTGKTDYFEAMREVFRNPGGCMDSIFFANADGNVLKADTLESSQVTFFDNFTPNGVIVGWGDILQQMYIGDHVVAFIPWFLAYGQKGSLPNIDPYSNLYFRIELCDITHWGGTVE